MTTRDSVALYARVSSESQARDNTIASQVTALRERIAADGFQLEPDHNYVDEGYSGAILFRPALERLRDAIAGGQVERIYVHAPDRLARRYAHQVLLIDEFSRAGTEVVFLNHPIGRTQGGGIARFEVVESEAPIIRLIFAWIGLERMSLRAVCRRLQQMDAKPGEGQRIGMPPRSATCSTIRPISDAQPSGEHASYLLGHGCGRCVGI